MTPLYLLYQLVAVLLGLVIGSFWNVCIARWPEDRSVVSPRSACPSCGTPILARDNVPVLGWMALGGRCRSCGWAIPPTYPLTELLGGLVGFLVWRRFVPDPGSLDVPHVFAALLYFALASGLLVGAFIDIRHRILPDEITKGLLLVGLLGHGLLDLLGYVGWMDIGIRGSVLGVLFGGAFFATLFLAAYATTGVEALGWGDVKLLAMIGAFLGPFPTLAFVCLAASFSGALLALALTAWRRRRVYTPQGPLYAFWTLTYVLFGDALVPEWTLRTWRSLTLMLF